MRKSSKEILHELLLERDLDLLPKRERFLLEEHLDELMNNRVNELQALTNLLKFWNKSDSIKEYIQLKLIEHAKNILANLGGLTMEQFEQKIKDLERSYERYGEIRNSIRPRLH